MTMIKMIKRGENSIEPMNEERMKPRMKYIIKKMMMLSSMMDTIHIFNVFKLINGIPFVNLSRFLYHETQ
jgi:hypothetical protein